MTVTPAASSRPPVLCFGEALIDLIATEHVAGLEDANEFVPRNGGAPANVAVALARLGVASAFHGAVGSDPFGSRLLAGLEAEGVDTSGIQRRPEPTTIAFTWKNARGDGSFWLLQGADTTLTIGEETAAAIAGAAAIVVGTVALAAEPSRTAISSAVGLAGDAAVPVCFDINLRPTLWPDLAQARQACQDLLPRTTLLKLSLDDARGLFAGEDDPEVVFHRLQQDGARSIIVITDGERGSWYRSRDGAVQHVEATRVDAVEPTGAGDAFLAALISRFLQNNWSTPDESDIRYASAAGALATLRPGAWDGLPTASELDAFAGTLQSRAG